MAGEELSSARVLPRFSSAGARRKVNSLCRSGAGRSGSIIPMPTVIDARTGVSVPNALWGEITLCWSRDAREWSLHIPYRTDSVLGLPQAQPDADGTYPADTVAAAVR